MKDLRELSFADWCGVMARAVPAALLIIAAIAGPVALVVAFVMSR